MNLSIAQMHATARTEELRRQAAQHSLARQARPGHAPAAHNAAPPSRLLPIGIARVQRKLRPAPAG